MRTTLCLAWLLSLSLGVSAQPPPSPASTAAPPAEGPKKGQMYRWKDANGHWQFTDTPPPQGAESYTPKAVLLPAKPVQDPAAVLNRPVSKPTAPPSYHIRFGSPQADAVITPDQSVVTVALSVEPALEKGHEVEVLLDGRPAFRGLSGELSGLERGTHRLSARVIDAQGNTLGTAEGPSFHVQRPHR